MNSNREMVDDLVERQKIKSEKIEKAFRSVDRADFVPEQNEAQAYEDRPLRIAEGATISAPHMVAINTELLEPEEDDKILEVGSGSGYQLAILAEISDEVVGVEINEELVEKLRQRLKDRENVDVVEGNGLKAANDRFDKILYSCAVNQEQWEKAKEILKDDGIIVGPIVNGNTQVLRKYKLGGTTEHGRVRFVEKK